MSSYPPAPLARLFGCRIAAPLSAILEGAREILTNHRPFDAFERLSLDQPLPATWVRYSPV
jgi:hypothetical protein